LGAGLRLDGKVDTLGLRGLGNAHFAALQATFGDDCMNQSDGRMNRSDACSLSVLKDRENPVRSESKQLQKGYVYFAAMHCDAMNVIFRLAAARLPCNGRAFVLVSQASCCG
jgi:hypothetical protein